MKIIFQTPSLKPSKKLLDFVTKKVATLDRLHNGIVALEVYLKKLKSDTPDNKVCEIRLSIPGNDLFASKKCDSFEEATLKTIDAIKRQLKARQVVSHGPAHLN
jgi:ribosome-associated translation inhibitor RaiA